MILIFSISVTRVTMPNRCYCAVPNCDGYALKHSNLSFHKFPECKGLQNEWLRKIKRVNGRDGFKVKNLSTENIFLDSKNTPVILRCESRAELI